MGSHARSSATADDPSSESSHGSPVRRDERMTLHSSLSCWTVVILTAAQEASKIIALRGTRAHARCFVRASRQLSSPRMILVTSTAMTNIFSLLQLISPMQRVVESHLYALQSSLQCGSLQGQRTFTLGRISSAIGRR